MIKTCAVCAHCSIDLGSHGYSDVTPGGPGWVRCGNGHDGQIETAWESEALMGLAKLGARCPDFELLAIDQSPETERNT